MNTAERERQDRQWAEEGLWLNHYHYMLQAVGMAMIHCLVWRTAGTDEVLTLDEMAKFASRYDNEHPLDEGQFFMITNEGAIGLSPGVEYLTQWLFVPMEPGTERDRLEQAFWDKMEAQETLELVAQQQTQARQSAFDADETMLVEDSENINITLSVP